MTQSIIPISAVPSQRINVTLSGVSVDLAIRELVGIFVDIYVGGKIVSGSILGLNRINMLRYKRMGIPGALYFLDTLGDQDPKYSGLGDRWILVYDDAA